MRIGRFIAGFAAVVLVAALAGAAGFAAIAWKPEIAPAKPPDPAGFDPAAVRRGAELAAVGNCNVCHTAPGGRVFAGGLPMPTPFGTIHSTNITPDPETGIGRWSEEAFLRSMREGVDREGRHLYPAFPYDHFTLATDRDIGAIYSFLMTRAPVRAETPANDLPFPLDNRMILAGWKLLFLREGPYRPDPEKSGEWNRGAYLVEGLGHCGACHTPRNALGATERDRHLAGAETQGWYAYALDGGSPAPIPWTVESLYSYLRRGWHAHHGVSRGSMAPVTANLAGVPESDVHAIAAYIASTMGEPGPERHRRAEALLDEAKRRPAAPPAAGDSQAVPAVRGEDEPGALLYAGACAGCHDGGRGAPYGGLDLALSSGVNGPTPLNAINVVLDGLPAAEGRRGAIMPGFRDVLTDGQVAALLGYMRSRFTDRPAWEGLDEEVLRVREGSGRQGP